MNIQSIMREAQKVQKDLQKAQKELESTNYEGKSSLVTIVLNGNKEMVSFKIDASAKELENDDIELLEDMVMVAYKDASKKVDADKEKKLGKFGQGLSGLI